MWTARFWKDAAERATKSAAQALVLYYGGGQIFDAWHFNWAQASGLMFGAGVLSLATSLLSSKVGTSESASLVDP